MTDGPPAAGAPGSNRTAAVLLTAAIIVTVAAVGYLRPSPPAPPADGNLLTTPAKLEPFTVVTLDGAELPSTAWTGKVVVVNFWATWCPPCVREMPALSALQDRLAGDLIVVGLLQDTVATEQARVFAKGLRIGYPIGRSTSELERNFPPVERLPMTYLLDRSSRLAGMYLGELDMNQLERDVRLVLARPD